MTVFGALTTAVTGLGAQSRALGHISDNIANSQTVGYKRVDTSFQTLVTQSNSSLHSPGGVRAKPLYTNAAQGPITQTQTTTNMAISGSGFFQVSRGEVVGGNVNFQSQSFFTRAGDFQLDRNGYLVNSAGYYLNGWGLRPGTSTVDRNVVQPIRVQQLIDNPTPTQNINLSANLPLTPADGATLPATSVPIIDLNGETRNVNMTWRKQGTNLWRLSVDAPGSSTQPTAGTLPGQPQSFGTPVQLIPNTTPQRQVSFVELDAGAPTSGEDYKITLNGKTFTYRAQSFDTTESVMGQLLNQINASGDFTDYAFSIQDFGAVPGSNDRVGLVITGPKTGSSFNLAATTSGSQVFTAYQSPNNTPSSAKRETTIPAGAPTPGDNYDLTIAGTLFRYTAVTGDTSETVATRLANLVNTKFANDPAFEGYSIELDDADTTTSDTAVDIIVTGPNNGSAFTTTFDIAGAAQGVTPTAGVADNTVSAATSAPLGIPLAAGVPGQKQQVFLPVTGTVGDVGDVFTIPFSDTGEVVSYTTDGTEPDLETIATRLAALVNENSSAPYSAQVSGAGLILTRKTFTNPTAINSGVGEPVTVDGRTPAHIEVRFGEGGILESLTSANVGEGNATVSPIQNSGDDAFITFTVDFGNGAQEIRLNLGDFKDANNGLTQYAGTAYEEFSLNQDGFTRGAFRDLSIMGSGEVVANYDNGRSRVLAQIPLFQVGNPEALQKVDGNAYVNTVESGNVRATAAGEGGAGNFVTSSIEGSNVDLADEFTKLIITQRAYSGNTRVVTASNEMLQEALSMGR